MAEYIPFDENVEVNGQTVLSVVNGVNEMFFANMQQILSSNGINSPKSGEWYSQKDWLLSFKEIGNIIGNYTLFAIGKSIFENADFPEEINGLKSALESIDVAYNQNHRGGEIGYYKLVSFDEKRNEAKMECKTPYPCSFDRGIISSIVRRFAPTNSVNQEVELDEEKNNKNTGADSSWYNISW